MEPSFSLSCQSHSEKLKTHKEIWYETEGVHVPFVRVCVLCTVRRVIIIIFAG